MGSRAKEDEKNERIIRGLLKLPENRRCINCNSLGPQYVCTSFWTFVCTTCSGIHREFTHRVKSVSMAKFTSQEVAALQEGGNQRARDIYLKEWDSQRQSGPDGSNVERLRDFIKHVYVDRRYTGERSFGKPPSTKMGEKEDSHDNRRSDTYQGGSRSPPYEDTYERRYGEMYSPGARSDNSRFGYDERRIPWYNQESQQYNDFRRSPARPEMVNDWRREDRFGNGWKGDGDPKLDSRSPERAKETSSPPVVRPVREILGDNVVPLRIIEPPKATVSKVANGPAQTQRTASSSSLGSTNENPVEVKLDHTKSLIDFDAVPEPPTAVTVPQVQQTPAPQSVTKPTDTTNDNNWASFDFTPQVQASQAPPNANPLESVLSQLSVSSSVPSHMSAAPGGSGVLTAAAVVNTATSPNTSDPFSTIPSAVPITSLSTFQPGGVSAVNTRPVSSMPVNGGPWPSVPQQQQPSLFPAPSGQSAAQQYTTPLAGASGNQPWNLSLAPNMQPALVAPSAGSPPVVLTPTSTVTSDGVSQAGEIKSTGRKALPEDLFSTMYSAFPAPMPGWQYGPPRAMGYTMQYPVATSLMPTFVQQPKSTNPFDVSQPAQVPVQAQVATFPSITSLHGALPNIPPSSGLQLTSSLGAPSGAWMPPQSSPYPAALPSQSLSYALTVPPRPYMVQQVPPSSMPLAGRQVMGGFGVEGAAFGAVHVDQQQAGSLSTRAALQPSSSVGGNPFG